MSPFGEISFWDELLHHDIEHGAGGKGEQPREQRLDRPGSQYSEQGKDRLHHAGGCPDEKGLSTAHSLLMQGQGDSGPFRKILDANSHGEGGSSG